MPDLFPDLVHKSAEFSPCRRYRYLLSRKWGDGLRVAFIGLNPSTADETQDDPTIRRCIGFAKAWGYGGLWMLNLFAFRATLPKDMKAAIDPVGPENDEFIYRVAKRSALVVAAWGVHGRYRNRSVEVAGVLGMAGPVHCLGVTQDGSPKHPLYLPRTAELAAYGGEEYA